MHWTHKPFPLNDDGLACEECHICECHSPDDANKRCPFASADSTNGDDHG